MKKERRRAWRFPREMSSITRLTSALLLGLFCMSFQGNLFSQQVKVSLDARQKTLNEVLQELGRQTGLNFLYNHEMARERGRVNVQATDKALGELLAEFLPTIGLEHVYMDNGVVIREKTALQQQQHAARGKV
ncbi:MAG: hypothetical protein LBD64_05600, partial [Odoribacteraceae bacterium]|nr:hypothetical protein [Odoribacteraceae bacterium]